ncbi:ABC transporter substrate-binding protein [Paenibacillus eucommiae]|uniref:Iron complex transport system substrate-binding protein n=1 Tax=Paenibacillus eucommiae TaxID=1355755 RepID=A0ABS4IU10_9BACL|nr:ABC transporter substrate-binding protein [Paenibacillus eucommiae]MBP1990511.1 iron complex transport system substrate-binding protein [Paenibacillus eucommiae]
MKQARKMTTVLCMIVLMGAFVIACNSKGSDSPKETTSSVKPSETPAPQQTEAATGTTENTTRKFTDWTKHEVEVPTHPQRVIYHGETMGDLLALGVMPIGGFMESIQGTIYEDKVKEVQDVGFPISAEKSLALEPDLIIFGNSDEKQYEQISKVAPTVTFNTFDPLEDRMRILGDLFDKKKEAEDWIAAHTLKTQEMWKKLKEAGMKPGETASVFTMYPGNRLFVMAGAGLPQFLYTADGFKPTPKIEEMIKDKKGFVEISTEVLSEYAGDRIFLLEPVPPEAKQSQSELVKSQLWLNLPAVKEGKVYTFEILKAGSDATSREWLLEELPKVLNK